MKVGDYVRTKYGISKIEEDRRIKYGFIHPVVDILKKEVIIKSSPNIIDLIEIGDYVNGHLVKNRRASCNENLGGHPKQVDIGENEDYIWISESKIKTIVTKEQFKNMEYEVE